MPLEFYWGSGSCNSWRVHLALELKRVPYDSRLLQLSKKDHKTPEHLALNPRGKVPVLRDGEYTLYESVAMLLYIDRRFPEPPIFGRSPEDSGRIMRWVSEHVCYIEPRGDAVILPFYKGEAASRVEALREPASLFGEELDRMQTALTSAPWLAGDAVSAADLTVFPEIMHLLRAAGKDPPTMAALGLHPLSERHPAVAAWVERVQRLPGYDRTYPPHWR